MRYNVKIYDHNGSLLLHTWNVGEHSRDMEIDAALSRKDVAYVDYFVEGAEQFKKRKYREPE